MSAEVVLDCIVVGTTYSGLRDRHIRQFPLVDYGSSILGGANHINLLLSETPHDIGCISCFCYQFINFMNYICHGRLQDACSKYRGFCVLTFSSMFGNEAIDFLKEALVTLDFVVSLINMKPEEKVAMPGDKKPFRQTATYQNIVARIEIIKTKLNDSSLN